MGIVVIFAVIIFPLLILGSIRKDTCQSKYLIERQETNVIRGISAVFIIESHFCAWVQEMGENANRVVEMIIGQLGGIGVLLFFFISGYGIYISYAEIEPSWRYLQKRLESVYIPYVFMKLIILFLFYMNGTKDSLFERILKIIMLEDWFIRVIVLQYLTFFFLWKIVKLKKNKLLYGSLIVNCILSVIFVVEQRPSRWFNALWLFIVGFVIAEYRKPVIEWFNEKYVVKCLFLFIGFLCSGILFAFFKSEVFWINIFKVISGCFLVVLMCGILKIISLKSVVLEYIGKRSLYYYIVHLNVWESLKQIRNSEIKVVLAVLITVIFSEILFFCYKRLKEMVNELLYKR